MTRRSGGLLAFLLALSGCGSTPTDGTLAELEQVPANIDDVFLEDSLERAAQSYRDYLNETPRSALTPEAMRRLADLQLEREYGVIVSPERREVPVGEAAGSVALETHRTVSIAGMFEDPEGGAKSTRPVVEESDFDFEERATDMTGSLAGVSGGEALTPGGLEQSVPVGPLEALETYRTILQTYPNYERNDQVLYQMSRAHDELGQTEEAIAVMARLVEEYPYSKYVDEVRFRRGEYFFVRRKYLDAENEYSAIIGTGSTSSYYELALYKLGWTLYKQELYEQSLDRFLAMLDYKLETGYDFSREYDETSEEGEEHRVEDTFRVISLSFSNLGGADILADYFGKKGHRSYADRIYSNLGEFYFSKLRYEDAASVYRSFIDQNPVHRASPHFSMRVIDIYGEAGFPKLVVEAKKRFATDYAVDSPYWTYHDIGTSEEVVGFLKANLTDLAKHYHSLFQDEALVDERPASFSEAGKWYRQFLASFPQDSESPVINYQLADLLLENENYRSAATEYERTAYDYGSHEKASAAGYAAVYAWREQLKLADGDGYDSVRAATVDSSLRFADTFQGHEQAPVVLGAAADDLYAMADYSRAIESARKLIDRYPGTDPALLLSAWGVVATSSIDIADYRNAELAYLEVLALTPEDDESRPAVIDGLAASIYKQGEDADAAGDFRAAADHFLRIRAVAPTSTIRTAAEYDAAAALMKLEDWSMAAGVLEDFRSEFPEHELNKDATKQLAYIYREDGQIERSADEHVRIADEASDPELARDALLVAGDLYEEAGNIVAATGVFERYVNEHPRPLDLALETRNRLAGLFRDQSDYVRYHEQLGEIVAIDRAAGAERTDRSRYLAANAALVLAELSFERFDELELRQPFEESLAEKQARMDAALASFESLVDYEVATVTAAATFYIAEIYFDFSASLLDSERPAGLSPQEQTDYEMVIEEEAYPFEEQAIEVHEKNYELLVSSRVYNDWVQRSLDKLAVMVPGRYAKNELSAGYVGSIDYYAYRMPAAPSLDAVSPDSVEPPTATDASPHEDIGNTDVTQSAELTSQNAVN